MCVTIEVDSDVVDLLVRTDWLAKRDAYERDEIARAIEALLRDSAR
jgi:hypothetical protein